MHGGISDQECGAATFRHFALASDPVAEQPLTGRPGRGWKSVFSLSCYIPELLKPFNLLHAGTQLGIHGIVFSFPCFSIPGDVWVSGTSSCGRVQLEREYRIRGSWNVLSGKGSTRIVSLTPGPAQTPQLMKGLKLNKWGGKIFAMCLHNSDVHGITEQPE